MLSREHGFLTESPNVRERHMSLWRPVVVAWRRCVYCFSMRLLLVSELTCRNRPFSSARGALMMSCHKFMGVVGIGCEALLEKYLRLPTIVGWSKDGAFKHLPKHSLKTAFCLVL